MISNEIEDSVVNLITTVGDIHVFNKNNYKPIDLVFHLYTTFNNVYKQLDDIRWALDYISKTIKFETDILESLVNTVSEAKRKILKQNDILEFLCEEQETDFIILLDKCKTYTDIALLCKDFNFDIITTCDLLNYSIFNTAIFIQPTNKFLYEIKSSLIILLLNEIGFIKDLKVYYNEN